MTSAESRWIIVTSEAELRAALALRAAAARQTTHALRADDPVKGCIDSCQGAAVSWVRRQRPVALLVNDSREVLQLRIPSTGRVMDTWDGDCDVRCFAVTRTQQPFRTPSGSPFVKIIDAAEEARTEVVVVDPLFDGQAAYVEPWVPLHAPSCTDEFRLDVSTLTALDAREACLLYRTIFADEAVCPYREGLPFRFSRGGCDTMAQAVASRFEKAGLVVGKAWAFSKRGRDMTIDTSSRTGCRQTWWFHVAVLARQKDGAGFWVFDPIARLERGVVTCDEWKQDFGPNLGPVHLTTAAAYYHGCVKQSRCDIQHPCFSTGDAAQLDEELMIGRCALGCVSSIEGPPPYRCRDWDIKLPDCGLLK